MNHIITLVSSSPERPLQESHLEMVADGLQSRVVRTKWLTVGKAVDIFVVDAVSGEECRMLASRLAADQVDLFHTLDDGFRCKKLLIADMDNTMVVGETLDELAAHCGLKERIASITEQAMRGELNFQEALRERVAMLKGLSATALERTASAIEVMPGAELLIRTMKKNGAVCVLVSGGFTAFTLRVAAQLGFDLSHGNTLEIINGSLSGIVQEPILDHSLKLHYLKHYTSLYNLQASQTMAVGDGANDLPMLKYAGLGVGFHPKPILREQLDNCVLYGDLTCLLYAQGISGF